jgi:hypothetical protein
VQKRSSKGYSIQANYTFSHCISDLANPELAVAGSNFMIPNNRRADRSNCSMGDRRQLFNLSAVYETPAFTNAALRILASGWQISPIVRVQSGPFITVTSGVDGALTGQGGERANQVLPNVYKANRTLNSYLNPAAFSQPATGTYGNLGASNILAPGFIYINGGVTRTFKVREKQSFQVRFEGFNIPNHVNPSAPVSALNNPNFGRILAADDPRILQGAVKYVF